MEQFESLAEEINYKLAEQFEELVDEETHEELHEAETSKEARGIVENLEAARAELIEVQNYLNSLKESIDALITESWNIVSILQDQEEGI